MRINFLNPEKIQQQFEDFKMRKEFEIEQIKKLQLAFSIAKNVIKKFEGKVMNKRLINAINQAYEGNEKLIYFKTNDKTVYFNIHESYYGDNQYTFSSNSLQMDRELRNNIYEIQYRLELPYKNSIIHYEDIDFQKIEKYMQESIEGREKAIAQFKECFIEACKLETKINDFNEKYEHQLKSDKNLIMFSTHRN